MKKLKILIPFLMLISEATYGQEGYSINIDFENHHFIRIDSVEKEETLDSITLVVKDNNYYLKTSLGLSILDVVVNMKDLVVLSQNVTISGHRSFSIYKIENKVVYNEVVYSDFINDFIVSVKFGTYTVSTLSD